jgi:hypothetical protein
MELLYLYILPRTSKFHYRVHRSKTLTYRSQKNATKSPIFDFLYVQFNVIFPFTSSYFIWALLFRQYDHYFTLISHWTHSCYMPRQSQAYLFNSPNSIWCRVQFIKLFPFFNPNTLSAFCSQPPPPSAGAVSIDHSNESVELLTL